jgi:hypothetical protein
MADSGRAEYWIAHRRKEEEARERDTHERTGKGGRGREGPSLRPLVMVTVKMASRGDRRKGRERGREREKKGMPEMMKKGR